LASGYNPLWISSSAPSRKQGR